MTVEELILIDKYKVRRDSNLMSLYLQYFKEEFKYSPNCVGCSFATDWQKLVSKYSKKYVTLQKVNSMNTITIKRQQGKILAYKKDGRTYRQYDNILTDSFIKEFIVSGTDEENKERVKMFNFPVENTITIVETPLKEFEENGIIFKESERPNATSTLESLGNNSQPKKRGRKAKK